jgi:hypothetical protein
MKVLEIILSEAGSSSLGIEKLTKREGRAAKFLDLIDKGHVFNSREGPVTISKNNIPQLTKILKPENVGRIPRVEIELEPEVDEEQGRIVPLGAIYFDQAAWGEFGKGGDPEADIKPGTVFGHQDPEKDQKLTAELAVNLGAFPASQLADKIRNNEKIKSQGSIGDAIIAIVDEIDQGLTPTVPDLPKKVLSSIVNDAFEYIGILSLLKGVADFPNREEFDEHVGTDISDMVLYFPRTSNNPLTDSYALKGKGNSIFISSKGRKGGAASSLTALKVPDTIDTENETLKFIDYIKQTGKAWHQPFLAANFIFNSKSGKGKLGELEESGFVPFTSEVMSYIRDTYQNRRMGVPKKLSQVPEEFRPLFALVEEASKGSKYPLFYNVRNYVKTVVHEAVNEKNAIPSWNSTMLEILGFNFIVLKTEIKSKQFLTQVRWPNGMDGKITLEHKDPADKWDSSMTWKLN